MFRNVVDYLVLYLFEKRMYKILWFIIENFITDSKTTFDDVVGLADAKTKLLEDVILPIKYPELFQGIQILINFDYYIQFLFLDKHTPSPFILIYGVNLHIIYKFHS